MDGARVIYIVIPCFNEEAVLGLTASVLHEKLTGCLKEGKIDAKSRVLFVDDGSEDGTWEIIKTLSEQSDLFTGIRFTKNKGHQVALLAGLTTAKDYADAVISMDADLQDDIMVLDKFLEAFNQGNEIVYGVRSCRDTDTFLKRVTAESYYKMMAKMGVDIVFNHADCRLMSKRALGFLTQFREVNLFLRGIVPTIGLKSTIITYSRNERAAGKSKYSLKKMLHLAFDGITSFSIKPIRLVTIIGGILLLAGAISLVIEFFCRITGIGVVFHLIMISIIIFFSGIQMLSLGIVGEYTGKIYAEVKARPRYFIEETLLHKD